MPRRGPRHLPPALPARARALPQRPGRGSPCACGAGRRGESGGKRSGGAPRCGRKGLMVRSRGRGRGREWEGDAERWGQRQRERGCQSPGLGDSSPQLSRTPPERALHRRHQLPVPALHLSCHHGAQALPPAGAARRRPHQPHPAPAGQGPGLWTLAGGAQLAAEQGSLPGLPCVPHWLQESLVAGQRYPHVALHFTVYRAFSWSPSLMDKGTGPQQEVARGLTACQG